jgi:POT family proton-dependent oligopeptide transporter
MSTRDPDRAFFGHPGGLSTLFFTEMWERFSYYGMRAFLFIYMTSFAYEGGRDMTKTSAGLVMALYLSSVYLLSLPGGWIADRFLGQRKAVTYGGIGIALGNVLLALPTDAGFYPGLAGIALGTGLLKPNISTIVGQLYKPEDIRRDAGYTIYYMGINIGATFSPLVCGYLAQNEGFRDFLNSHGIDPVWCWHFGFAAAAIGMVAGLIQYVASQGRLGESGLHPNIPTDPKVAAGDRTKLGIILGGLGGVAVLFAVMILAFGVSGEVITNIFGVGLAIGAIILFYGMFANARDRDERRRIVAMIPLFIGAIGFFGVFEQASTTLSDFAEHATNRELFGITIEASYYQMPNGIFIVLLAPVFAALWLRLARAGKEPQSVMKFSIGMVFMAVSFIVMLPTISTVTSGGRVSGLYLIALYFWSTCSELCISPVGLSSMNKLAPKRLAGMVMGVWFLGTAIGNYCAGRAAQVTESQGISFLFYSLIILALVLAAALFFVAPVIKRMMGAPAPLPKAQVTSSS